MKIGSKIYIPEMDSIGVVTELHPTTKQPTKVSIGDKIVDITGKTIKILTWLLQLWIQLKNILK